MDFPNESLGFPGGIHIICAALPQGSTKGLFTYFLKILEGFLVDVQGFLRIFYRPLHDFLRIFYRWPKECWWFDEEFPMATQHMFETFRKDLPSAPMPHLWGGFTRFPNGSWASTRSPQGYLKELLGLSQRGPQQTYQSFLQACKQIFRLP